MERQPPTQLRTHSRSSSIHSNAGNSSPPSPPTSHSSPASSDFHSPPTAPRQTPLKVDPATWNALSLLDSLPLSNMEGGISEEGMSLEDLVRSDAFDPNPSTSYPPQNAPTMQFCIPTGPSFSPSLPMLPSYPTGPLRTSETQFPSTYNPSDQPSPPFDPSVASSPSLPSPPPVKTQSRRNTARTRTGRPSPNPRNMASSSTAQAVTTISTPDKSALTNLPIVVHNVPEHGAKSRVETQIRMTIDLAFPSDSNGGYSTVGSWPWLRLPKGSATKKRPRKEGKVDAKPSDTLYLSADVHCASSGVPVFSCTNCLAREAKRTERKKASRIRPERMDEDSGDDADHHAREDGIVSFNCTELMDFSKGSVILPVRMTCYCRHHNERVGFRLTFTMTDYQNRVIGKGFTPPIMITDDHKSTKSAMLANSQENVMDQTTKRKRRANRASDGSEDEDDDESASDSGETRAKRRAKEPVANLRPPPAEGSRRASALLATPAPSSVFSTAPPSPHSVHSSPPPSNVSSVNLQASSFFTPSPTDDGLQLDLNRVMAAFNSAAMSPQVPLMSTPTALPQAAQYPTSIPSLFLTSNPPPVPYTYPQTPQIHRLIPASGPVAGGIEVTILGANFTTDLQCLFGGSMATSTTFWSENTLVCILPPSSTPGTVMVSFKDAPIDPARIQCFTYLDNTDRALMEMALQVVGFKMTGRFEEARSVALRIVNDDSRAGDPSMTGQTIMQAALTGTTIRQDFQAILIRFLTMLDIDVPQPNGIPIHQAISHSNATGQTLLHLSCILGFHRLVSDLIQRGIDLNVRDANGYTALHFASLCGRVTCARILIDGGADLEVVDGRGRTARELATEKDQPDVQAVFERAPFSLPDSPSSSVELEHVDGAEADESAGDDSEGWWSTEGETEEDREASQSLSPNLPRVPLLPEEMLPESDVDFRESRLNPKTEGLPPSASLTGPDIRADEKPSFFHRTLSHFPPGMIPPWAIPNLNLPIALPMQVPNLPWLQWQGFGYGGPESDGSGDKEQTQMIPPLAMLWAAYALANPWRFYAGNADASATDVPMYRFADSTTPAGPSPAAASTSTLAAQQHQHVPSGRVARRREYDDDVQVSDREVRQYSNPTVHSKRKLKKDHMLRFFWIPMLTFGIAWALYHSVPVALGLVSNTVRRAIPQRALQYLRAS